MYFGTCSSNALTTKIARIAISNVMSKVFGAFTDSRTIIAFKEHCLVNELLEVINLGAIS